MNRHGVRDFGGADNGRHVEVRKSGLGRTDAYRLIGQKHMLGVEIRRGMYRHGLDAELAARPQYTKGDLAAVRDDDFFDHLAYSMMNSGWPNSTGSPFFANIAVTRPALSDSIWFIIFMASMMQSIWPTLISLPSSTKDFSPGEAEA